MLCPVTLNQPLSAPKKMLTASTVVVVACLVIALLSKSSLPPLIVASTVGGLSATASILLAIRIYSRKEKEPPTTEVLCPKVITLPPSPLLQRKQRTPSPRLVIQEEIPERAETPAAATPPQPNEMRETLREAFKTLSNFFIVLCHTYQGREDRKLSAALNSLEEFFAEDVDMTDEENPNLEESKQPLLSIGVICEGIGLLSQSPYSEELPDYMAEVYAINKLVHECHDPIFQAELYRCEYALSQKHEVPVTLHALEEGDQMEESERVIEISEEDQPIINALRSKYPRIARVVLESRERTDEDNLLSFLQQIKARLAVSKHAYRFGAQAMTSAALETALNGILSAALFAGRRKLRDGLIQKLGENPDPCLVDAVERIVAILPDMAKAIFVGNATIRTKTKEINARILIPFRQKIAALKEPLTLQSALHEFKLLLATLSTHYRSPPRTG